MELLSFEESLAGLACPICRGGMLSPVVNQDTTYAVCAGCQKQYDYRHSVIDFIIDETLNSTNLGEIEGNKVDLTDCERVDSVTSKGKDNPIYMWQMRRTTRILLRMFAGYGPDFHLYALGSGSGFDVALLSRHRSFARIFSSDIALTKTSIVPKTLADFPGQLGLFASEFRHCPVRKRPGNLGLVFQALHHAPDAHGALELLLDHNFDDIVIVEPVTNPFVEFLSLLGLAKRVEYSGVKPDWMSLKRIRKSARQRGYKMRAVTWWEPPPCCSPPWLRPHAILWRPMCWAIDLFSRLTNLFNFGCMAAIHIQPIIRAEQHGTRKSDAEQETIKV